ncbi:hypothetical protein [Poseidonocella sedimentorum]|uniref:Uncharacterized protein n=1 Tax=Poseidonocella sedimentorum TaxID=871652 RepID=A0A1I6DIF5_9RHOB|nr:hypothetical protein [Poseidonocella sedimentorum]SFR05209.1 hypothetical protein SAMN04515673_103325 [Poseidonocella sedimentorum]
MSRARRCPAPRALRGLALDPSEFVILSVLRLYVSSFTAPERQHWLAGLTCAQRFFGEEAGPGAACAILAGVQALRQSRVSPLRITAPEGPGPARALTDHERLFILSLRAMRQGQKTAAEGFALLLCEGNDTGPLLRSLAKIAALSPPAQGAAKARPVRDAEALRPRAGP